MKKVQKVFVWVVAVVLLASGVMSGKLVLASPTDGFMEYGPRLPWTTGQKWDLTSGYDEDYHYDEIKFKVDFARRFGIGIPDQPGTRNKPVLAIGDGRIVEVHKTNDYPEYPATRPPIGGLLDPLRMGVYVAIDHGNGWYTQYDHLAEGSVDSLYVGQEVSSGEQIGLSGDTGFSIGYHIQVSLWKGGWQTC